MTPATSLLGKFLSLTLFAIVSVQFFWMVFPATPITYSNLRILTPIVTAGGELGYAVTLDKESVYPATISRILIACDSKKVYPLKLETGALPPGIHDVEFHVRIPDFVEPGRYRLKSISVYEVNPLKNVVTGFETQCFQVVKH